MINQLLNKTLKNADINGKKVLLRAGFDLPIENGTVTDDSRIKAMIESMKYILENGGSLLLLAHQGRPKGKVILELSQKPLIPVLEKYLNITVKFADSCTGENAKVLADSLLAGEVLLLENVRFDPREKSKIESERDALAKEIADLADIYVNDAFTNCHRNHASMTSIPKYLPAYMGMHLEKEVTNLSIVFNNPPKPITLIISGAKLETKVPVIENFFSLGENILVGGLIANSLLCASGKKIGCSKFEEDQKKEAERILSLSKEEGNATLHLPTDTLVADNDSDEANMLNVNSNEVPDDMVIFDIGEATALNYSEIIEKSGLIIWNGPLGKYETLSFSKGSKAIANAVNKSTKNGAISLIGGGDTTDFHIKYNLPLDEYTWVSTGGGAMLNFLSGEELPAFKALI